MTNPLINKNPQDFKLRIVWGFEGNSKMVVEFPNSRWIPQVGEIMILPIDKVNKSIYNENWHKFKIETIAYDFQNQITRVICKSINKLAMHNNEFDDWMEQLNSKL
ncbi:MAG: hypothetical protein QNJ63_01320 [Calothrix sp. MO_192.B10]|nr:hypothetical protein [Calothrix sp. MO_192.B10]